MALPGYPTIEPGPTMRSMLAISLAVHLVVALVAVAWWNPLADADRAPREVMTISLGGATGPRAGGLTQLGGPAQPSPAVPRPEPPRPAPAAPSAPVAPPAVSKPAVSAKPTAPSRSETPAPARTSAEPGATSREVTAPPDPGTTPTNTGARGQGFGLSSGGGGSRGVELDVGNFCCPEYLAQMIALIQRNWQQGHGVSGTTKMVFTIRRDGTIDGIAVDRSSRFLALDNAADRALRLTRQLPPLPAQFPNPTLTVRMYFEYQQ
jgi:TonB family protein